MSCCNNNNNNNGTTTTTPQSQPKRLSSNNCNNDNNNNNNRNSTTNNSTSRIIVELSPSPRVRTTTTTTSTSSSPLGPTTTTTTAAKGTSTNNPSTSPNNLSSSSSAGILGGCSNTTQQNTQLVEDWNSLAAAAAASSYYDSLEDNDDDSEQQQQFLNRPWGRLTHNSINTTDSKNTCLDLFPRPSSDTFPTTNNTTTTARFMGLQLYPGQIFNEYTLGRSPKVDFILQPLSQSTSSTTTTTTDTSLLLHPITSKIHAMISNRHAKLYCLFLGTHHHTSNNTNNNNNNNNNNRVEVYIEDTSGNGTLINSTVKLRKGEKRLLHSGDTICFVNPQIVYGVIHSTTATTEGHAYTLQWKQQLQRDIVQHYSYHFLNLYLQHQQQPFPIHKKIQDSNSCMLPPPNRYSSSPPLPPSTPNSKVPNYSSGSSSSKKYGDGIVNVRAIHSPSQLRHHTPQNTNHPPQPVVFESQKNIHSNTTNGNIHQTSILPAKRKQQQRRQQPSPSISFEEQYDLREILGSGTCGQVRRAIHRKTGKVVAVKIISMKKKMPTKKKNTTATSGQRQQQTSDTDTSEQEAIQAEATLLQSLSHPYIVQMYDMHVDKTNVYIVMELVEGGDLLDSILSHGCYSERGARQIMRRLLSALVYLHSQHIVHRDLKPENILVPPLGVAASRSTTMIKITDFGVAKQLTEDGLAQTFCGTPQYFAPEVLRRQNTVTGTGRYGGPAADCWSLGVVLYILLSGYQPFDYNINPNQNNLITCGSWEVDFSDAAWHPITQSAKDLITKLLCTDATKRISAKDACTHEWILINDGDTHTHPLDDPLLVIYGKQNQQQSPKEGAKQKQRKELPDHSMQHNQLKNDRNSDTSIIPSSTTSVRTTKSNGTSKKNALDIPAENHHDDDDDEVLSDFSNEVTESNGQNDSVEENRTCSTNNKDAASFWRPDKLRIRKIEEQVKEEQNLDDA